MSIAQRLYTVGITEVSPKFAWQFRDLKIEKNKHTYVAVADALILKN